MICAKNESKAIDKKKARRRHSFQHTGLAPKLSSQASPIPRDETGRGCYILPIHEMMLYARFDYPFCRRAIVVLPIYFLASIFIAGLGAQQQPPPIQSPEISPDRRVTFRFRNPNAKEVFLAREGAQRVTMQKDEQGVWSVTTDPLEPEIYGYSFVADGVGLMDPANRSHQTQSAKPPKHGPRQRI